VRNIHHMSLAQAAKRKRPYGALYLLATSVDGLSSLSVVACTIRPGETTSRHHHSSEEVFFIVSGGVKLLSEGDILELKKHDVAAVMANQIHQLHNNTEEDCFVLIAASPHPDRSTVTYV